MAIYLHGAFNFPRVPPGDYQMLGNLTGGPLAILSIASGGKAQRGDQLTVGDRPLSLVVTAAAGSTRVEGFAQREGKGAAGVMIVAVPGDLRSLDTLARRDQSDTDGSFALRDVVPGKYTLVAIEDGWGLEWDEPRVISRYLPGGVAVTIPDGSGKRTALPSAIRVQAR